VPKFNTTLITVVGLATLSAASAVGVAILNAFIPLALAPDLIHAFLETFKACSFAILGLLGGRMTSNRSKS
jgi:hypothetical protein